MYGRAARAPRSSSIALALTLGACAVTLGACANTLQDEAIPHNTLEGLLIAPYPVYWLGDKFKGMQITATSHDPSDAYTIQYGDCLEGGESTCVAPLRVVTSPDNSFLPGGNAPRRVARIRGVNAVIAREGRAIEIATGSVVVDVIADDPRLAGAASETIVPINAPGAPGAPLPPRLPNSGFANLPLPGQVPTSLGTVR